MERGSPKSRVLERVAEGGAGAGIVHAEDIPIDKRKLIDVVELPEPVVAFIRTYEPPLLPLDAEPEDSGQRLLFTSPGLSWNLGKKAQVYAFAQLPLYQAVNGVQLTARYSFVAGVSSRF